MFKPSDKMASTWNLIGIKTAHSTCGFKGRSEEGGGGLNPFSFWTKFKDQLLLKLQKKNVKSVLVVYMYMYMYMSKIAHKRVLIPHKTWEHPPCFAPWPPPKLCFLSPLSKLLYPPLPSLTLTECVFSWMLISKLHKLPSADLK